MLYMVCHISGRYIAIEIGVCAFTVVIQVIILHMHHGQGIGSISCCLMAIGNCRRGDETNLITETGATEHNKNRKDRDCSESDVTLQEQPSAHDNEHDSKDDRFDVVPAESANGDNQDIAIICDKFCFVLFLLFHVLIIITVALIVAKTDD